MNLLLWLGIGFIVYLLTVMFFRRYFMTNTPNVNYGGDEKSKKNIWHLHLSHLS